MTPADPAAVPPPKEPRMTPALDALLKDVEALDREATPASTPETWGVDALDAGIGPRHFGNDNDIPLIAHYRAAAPRLAAMLRVAVEALRLASDTDPWVDPVCSAATALARIEALAKGEA